MTTLADAVAEGIAPLGDDIYNSAAWADKREEYKAYEDIFRGAEWAKTTGAVDPDTGAQVLRYPLQINPAAKCCRIHRAVMFGMRDDVPALPVSTLVSAEGPGTRTEQLKLQHFINSTWRHSQGIAMMEESGLLLQVYGGHFFKVAWEFWNDSLPYRIAVRSLKSPAWCFPVYDIYDPWHLLEAYIGYYIPAGVAKTKYEIEPEGDNNQCLYLEHWTRSNWRITVDGQVPVMQWGDGEAMPLEGENPWNLVPIVYIPHERRGGFYGRSLVADLPGLARELNARLADEGDAVQTEMHRLLVLRNSRSKGPLKARKIILGGRYVDDVLDIGDAPPLQGSKDPDLYAVADQGPGPAITKFTDKVWDQIRAQADVAAVAMGDDDVSGGRITGPVTAYRMWPTISHTMTERADFTTGLNVIAEIMTIIAAEREQSGEYRRLGIQAPGITSDMRWMQLKQAWHPMIPMERTQKVQMLTLRLQAGGISIQSYLEQMGEDDIEQEIGRIREDKEWELRIEAALKATQQPEQEKARETTATQK